MNNDETLNLEEKTLTPFMQYVYTLLKENNLEQEVWSVRYSHERPFDSFDRLYALYVLEKRPDLLTTAFDNLNEADAAEFNDQSNHAYNNYEREMISQEEAYNILMAIAKGGIEVVRKDSYDDGGWFGAS